METDQQGLFTEEETSCKKQKITKVSEITDLHTTKPKTQSSNSTNITCGVAAERIKKGDSEKRSLTGITRQKSGRYAAVFTDRIRHKRVWLGTFDTVEEASQAYFSKKFEFEKLSQEDKSMKNSDQIQQTKSSASLSVDTHLVGAHKSKKTGKNTSEIVNPITRKKIWLGSFGTAEEASRAYQSKMLEFQKLVRAKRQCGNENVNCELESTAGGSEIDVQISNSSNGGTQQRIDCLELGTAEEAFHVYQYNEKQEFPCLMANVRGTKSSDVCKNSTSSNLKEKKTSLIGIRRRKSGRYSAKITDPNKHKQVWLGTFDTIEEASQVYFSKKSEFEKLRQGNKENKPKKNCDQIQQPESSPSVVASLYTASASGRDKRIDSHKTTTHFIGAHKSKKTGRYTSDIINPITKKKSWLGTFDTAEEASHAYQSKKLEFQKLVKAKQHQCNNKHTQSKQDGKSEKLVNVKQEHENVNCELESAGGSEINGTISNSSSGGTGQWTNSHEIGAAEEAFHAYLSKKVDSQSSKKVELQSNMPTDSSVGEKQEGQEDDEDLSMGQWIQLPGDRAVMFSLKLGLPIIDNYGSLLGEFSSLDDLSIS